MPVPTKLMTGLAAAALCTLPMTAMGEPIPQKTLNEHRSACETRCAPDANEAYCQRMCACVTDHMNAQWDAEDYKVRHQLMSDDPQNERVRSEFEQFILYCKGRLEPNSQ